MLFRSPFIQDPISYPYYFIVVIVSVCVTFVALIGLNFAALVFSILDMTDWGSFGIIFLGGTVVSLIPLHFVYYGLCVLFKREHGLLYGYALFAYKIMWTIPLFFLFCTVGLTCVFYAISHNDEFSRFRVVVEIGRAHV